MENNFNSSRRKFIGKSKLAIAGIAVSALPINPMQAQDPTDVSDVNIIGPKKGYTPQIGTMLSMMNWMRDTILYSVRGMSVAELDYIHDEDSNSIGAMLWHLASTEKFYQLNTFEGIRWGNWSREDKKNWNTAMALGNAGRKEIKGNSLDFYLEKLESVRNHTKTEFAKRDDAWLLEVDKKWAWGPTNNYCKWFHVCEHESNHNGQIKYIKSRVSV